MKFLPRQRGDNKTGEEEVKDYEREDELEGRQHRDPKGEGVGRGGEDEGDEDDDEEGRVIPGPLVLGLLVVVDIPVDPLGRHQQPHHLRHCHLKVHLPNPPSSPHKLPQLPPPQGR